MRRFGWAAVASIRRSASLGSADRRRRDARADRQTSNSRSSSPPIPSNAERLLVAEREGVVVEVARRARSQIADLTSLVTCCECERGLLSIAPAPDFDSQRPPLRRLYRQAGGRRREGDVHVDSFRPDPRPDALIREPILSVSHAARPNHNGGQLQFGPDGHLYISLGDGGGGGDPLRQRRRTPKSLLGKILRIDPHPGQSRPTRSRPGNPFAGGAGPRRGLGLRPAQPLALLLRPGQTATWSSPTSARTRARRSTSRPSPAPGRHRRRRGSTTAGTAARASSPTAGARRAAARRAASPNRPSTTRTKTPATAPPTAARSSAATWSAIQASATSTAATSTPTSARAKSARSRCRARGGAPAAIAPRGSRSAEPTSFGEDACGRVYVASEEGTVYRLEGPSPAVCPQPAVVGDDGPEGPVLALATAAPALRQAAAPGGSRFRLKARLAPCGAPGHPIQLNREGKSFSTKHLDRHCRARFLFTVAKPTRLRAFVRIGGKGHHVGSRRLVLLPPRQP